MDYTLVAPFLTDDPMFARGVQYGMIYMRLRHTKRNRITEQFVEADEEQIRLMAHRIGWTVKKRFKSHEWITIIFERNTKHGDNIQTSAQGS